MRLKAEARKYAYAKLNVGEGLDVGVMGKR